MGHEEGAWLRGQGQGCGTVNIPLTRRGRTQSLLLVNSLPGHHYSKCCLACVQIFFEFALAQVMFIVLLYFKNSALILKEVPSCFQE